MYQQNGIDEVKSVVQKVLKLFQDGKIKPQLDSTWALEDVSSCISKSKKVHRWPHQYKNFEIADKFEV